MWNRAHIRSSWPARGSIMQWPPYSLLAWENLVEGKTSEDWQKGCELLGFPEVPGQSG